MSITIHHSLTNIHPRRFSPAAWIESAARSFARALQLWRSRHRERNVFATLDERDLRDLRVSRWEVERELAKPFWRG
jgi:uncharacterized protein YjiS (DUF1127 family)